MKNLKMKNLKMKNLKMKNLKMKNLKISSTFLLLVFLAGALSAQGVSRKTTRKRSDVVFYGFVEKTAPKSAFGIINERIKVSIPTSCCYPTCSDPYFPIVTAKDISILVFKKEIREQKLIRETDKGYLYEFALKKGSTILIQTSSSSISENETKLSLYFSPMTIFGSEALEIDGKNNAVNQFFWGKKDKKPYLVSIKKGFFVKAYLPKGTKVTGNESIGESALTKELLLEATKMIDKWLDDYYGSDKKTEGCQIDFYRGADGSIEYHEKNCRG